jgi:hypothetical protein
MASCTAMEPTPPAAPWIRCGLSGEEVGVVEQGLPCRQS